MYEKFPVEFVTNYNSIQVEVSPLNPEMGDVDEWKITPVLPDTFEVSDHLYTKK